MYSKVIMLLWERWRRTYWTVIAASLVPLSGGLLYAVGYTTEVNSVKITNTLFALFIGLLTMVLLAGHCEARDLDLAFPKRLFRFPVPTTMFFALYMGYGVVAVAFPFLLIIGVNKLIYESVILGWDILLIQITLFILLQTLCWLGGPARFLCIALSLAFVYTLLKVAAMFNLLIGINILCLITILLSCGISLWSVSQYRHGGWLNSWKWEVSFLGIFKKKQLKPFSSALHAQIWFELRRIGHLYPLTALCFMSPFLGWLIYSLVIRLPPSTPMSTMIPSMFFVMNIAPLIAGFILLAVYSRDHISGASNFLLRHPMATRTLAAARLQAMVRSFVRVIVIITVVSLAVVMRDWATGALDTLATFLPVKWALKYGSPLEVITMTILGLYGYALFCWTLFRLNLILAVGGMILAFIILLMTSLIGDVAAIWIWNVIVVGLIVTVLVAFYIARRRNLITTTTLVIIVCMFPLAVISLWAYPWFSSASGLPKGLPDLNQFQIIRIIAAATLPFIPVATTPLLMDKLRHR